MLRRLLITFAFLTLCTTAFAQGFVPNPTRVEFEPSADDAQVVRYELGYFLVGATAPMQIGDLGRPACAPLCVIPLPARPVPIGRYVAAARAVAVDTLLISEWSTPSNEFGYTPRPPGRPDALK